MILVPCPNCGKRNSLEFRYVGEVKKRPDPASVDPKGWRAYLYENCNALGWVQENWYHALGCRRFFRVERHTLTNRFNPGQESEASAPDREPADATVGGAQSDPSAAGPER